MREMFVPQQFCAFRNMFFVAQVIDAMLDLGWSDDTKKLDHVKLTRLKLDMIKNFTTAFRKVPGVLGQIWDAIEGAAVWWPARRVLRVGRRHLAGGTPGSLPATGEYSL